MWQCYIDKLLENELASVKRKSSVTSKSRVLTQVEQNAIRYAAGSVIRKLGKKWRNDYNMKECLYGLLKEEGEDDPDSTEQWIETTDRGGLYYITDNVFELFIEVEIFVFHHLSQSDHILINNY